MPNRLQIDPKYAQILQAIFSKYYKDEDIEVLAYGSRLGPYHHAGSDLDLVVRHSIRPDEPHPATREVIEAIKESNIPILVDFFDWATIPLYFREEINKNHVVFWKVSK